MVWLDHLVFRKYFALGYGCRKTSKTCTVPESTDADQFVNKNMKHPYLIMAALLF